MDFKVGFMIIGAQKSGTTSLAQRLAENSSICFCREKEPHFFSGQQDWDSKIGRYHELFKPWQGQVCGEASTSYSFIHEYPEIPMRLYQYNPALKLIYILRDPIERIQSHYAHRLMRGLAQKPPELEILNTDDYLNRSRYGTTIQHFLDFFPKKQILVLLFETYIENPHAVMKQLYDFLEIPYSAAGSTTAKNRSVGSNRSRLSPLFYIDNILAYSPPFIRRLLSDYITIKLAQKPRFPQSLTFELWDRLKNDVKIVEGFLGTKMSAWRCKYEMDNT